MIKSVSSFTPEKLQAFLSQRNASKTQTASTTSNNNASPGALNWTSSAGRGQSSSLSITTEAVMSTTESLTLTSSSVRLNEDDVIIDSGASNHAFNNRKWFTSLKTLDQPYRTATFSGGHAQAQEVGEVKLEFVCSDGSTTIGDADCVLYPDGSSQRHFPGSPEA